ncbi:MAG: EFR1 family ferrodoxin [Chloroflexota bacterium]
MKGAIFYHSSSGNTRLVCRFLIHNLKSVPFDLIDIVQQDAPHPGAYDVVGFATWTYHLGLPPRFHQFLQALPAQPQQPAFLLSTFGMMPGRALWQMERLLTAKGWLVLGGHSLWVPENYPPFIVKGWASAEAPAPKELDQFRSFVAWLDQQMIAICGRQAPERAPIKVGLLNRLLPVSTPQKARRKMGCLHVDASLCDGCGLCQAACQYEAIAMSTTPVFRPDRCHACWACFNHCPQRAIFTEKIRGVGQYAAPSPTFVAKLTIPV